VNCCTWINEVLYFENHCHAYKFYSNHIFFDGAFEYGGGSKFVGSLGQKGEVLRVQLCNLCSVMYL
jgi:hypothetical protein